MKKRIRRPLPTATAEQIEKFCCIRWQGNVARAFGRKKKVTALEILGAACLRIRGVRGDLDLDESDVRFVACHFLPRDLALPRVTSGSDAYLAYTNGRLVEALTAYVNGE